MFDVIVVGAGVIGLAVSRELSNKGFSTLTLETNDSFGIETSSRNSEIVHSGLYYKPGSLRATLCVRGKKKLYKYCSDKGVPCKRLGKLLVATTVEEISKLKGYQETGRENNVELKWLSKKEAQDLEPSLRCEAALLSPSTGIVDSKRFMQSLLQDAQASGTQLVLNSKVIGGDLTGVTKRVLALNLKSNQRTEYQAKAVINAAGLHARDVAICLGVPQGRVPQTFLAKGNYFRLKGEVPFRHLVYPMPNEAGLGTHLTLDLNNQAKFGPDVEYISEIDYAVDPSRGEAFYSAIRRYWPELPDGSLEAGFSGIRPKLHGPGTPQGDFVIDFESLPGLVNLFGIESPGLTSSMAIAESVAQKMLALPVFGPTPSLAQARL